MLVVMQRDASQDSIDAVCEAIKAMGFQPVPMPGEQRTAIGLGYHRSARPGADPSLALDHHPSRRCRLR